VDKAKRIIREADRFSNNIITGLMLAIPNDLSKMGYVSIVIDESVEGAKNALNWIHRLIIEVPAEDNPDEMIGKIVEMAAKEQEYNLFASVSPILESGTQILEDKIRAKNTRSN
jgi:hypothetical protein